MSLSSSNGILSKILNGSGNRSSQRSDSKLPGVVSSAEDKEPSLVLMFPSNKAPMKKMLSKCFIMVSGLIFLKKVETKVLSRLLTLLLVVFYEDKSQFSGVYIHIV